MRRAFEVLDDGLEFKKLNIRVIIWDARVLGLDEPVSS
jgi:hypothetical protein